MNINTTCATIALSLGLAVASQAATLVTPTGVTSSTSGTDFRTADFIINDGGIEDATNQPIVPTIANYQTTHHIAGYNGISWVTTDFLPDYFGGGGGPIPVLTFDLGASYDLTDFVYWGYASSGSGNEASAFTLTFSTDGVTYGGAVDFDQNGSAVGTGNPATLSLGSTFTAQYVKVEITDNQGGIDRVALGEVKFIAVPEPSSAALLGLGGLALILRRRK